MKTLLLAGYRHETIPDHAPGLEVDANQTLQLDRRIDQIRALGHDVVCVLSGPAADLQIRRSRRLADVELVFDNNGADVSLMTNLRSGLAAVDDAACFCLPVEIPWPSIQTWSALSAVDPRSAPEAVLMQAREAGRDLLEFGFPVLITRRGVSELKRRDDVRSLADPDLRYFYLNL